MTIRINIRKTLATAIGVIAVFGLIGEVDAFAAAYPFGVGGTGNTSFATGTVPVSNGTQFVGVPSSTFVQTTTGNWQGTWQGANSSTLQTKLTFPLAANLGGTATTTALGSNAFSSASYYLASNPSAYISSTTGATYFYPLTSNPSLFLTSSTGANYFSPSSTVSSPWTTTSTGIYYNGGTVAVGSSLYAATTSFNDYSPFPASPLLWYGFDEGTGSSTIDWSANRNTGTWHGTTTGTSGYYSAGQVGPYSGTFDGSTNYITGSIPTMATGTNPFTITAWINVTTSTGTHVIMNLGATAVTTSSCEFWVNGSQLLCAGGGSNRGSVTANAWQMVAVTFDGANMIYYVNGVGTAPNAVTFSLGSNAFVIGSEGINSYFPGNIDDLRVYGSALTSSTLQSIYNGEKGTYNYAVQAVNPTIVNGSTAILGPLGINTFNPLNALDVNGNADFTGKVGIGTTTPSYALDVVGGIRASQTSTFRGNVGIGTSSPVNPLDVQGNADVQNSLAVGTTTLGTTLNDAGTLSVAQTSTFSGNVGIGTVTPATTLDVNGPGDFRTSLAVGTTTTSTATLNVNGGVGINGSSSVQVIVPTGSLLTGGCNTATTSIWSGFTTSTAVAFPMFAVDPGNNYYPKAIISASGVLTAEVCADSAGSPATTTVNIKLFQ